MPDAVEIYISVDVEADGPIPGDYSMTALGACVAGYRTADGTYMRVTPSVATGFYRNIHPLSNRYDPEAFNVAVFEGYTGDRSDTLAKREWLDLNGTEPSIAMWDFNNWVKRMQTFYGAKGAVFCAYPLGFDWLFTYWYMVKFAQSPFGHSRHIDIKTLYMAKANQTVSRSVKSNMPKKLRVDAPHTHNALDDALEQGELMMNILEWDEKK